MELVSTAPRCSQRKKAVHVYHDHLIDVAKGSANTNLIDFFPCTQQTKVVLSQCLKLYYGVGFPYSIS